MSNRVKVLRYATQPEEGGRMGGLGAKSRQNWGGIPGPPENGKSPGEGWVTSSWNGKTDGRERGWEGTSRHPLSQSIKVSDFRILLWVSHLHFDYQFCQWLIYISFFKRSNPPWSSKQKTKTMVLDNGKHENHWTVIWGFCLPWLHQPRSSICLQRHCGSARPTPNLGLHSLGLCPEPDAYLCNYE